MVYNLRMTNVITSEHQNKQKDLSQIECFRYCLSTENLNGSFFNLKLNDCVE